MKNYLFNYLLIFTPLLLISGPFLPDLACCILGLYIIYVLKKNNFKDLNEFKKIFYLFLSFNVYIILRSALSENPLLSFESSLFYFRFLFFSLAIVYLFSLDKKILYKFSFVALLSTLLLSIDSIFEYFFGFRLVGDTSPGSSYGRISSFFEEELIMGNFISKMLPFVIIFFQTNYSEKNLISNTKKFLFIPIIFLILFTVYLSGERTALFNTVLIITILIISFPNFKFIQKLFIVFFIYLLIVTSIFSLKNSQFDRLVENTYVQLFDSNNKNLHIFSIHHESHIRSAISMFKSNVIFGHGSKMFRELCSDIEHKYVITKGQEIVKAEQIEYHNGIETGCTTHPHHFYIQMLAENGVIGFLFLISLFIYFLRNLFAHIKKKYYLFNNSYFSLFIINTSLIITFNPFLPSMNLFNNWLSVIIYAYLGFYLSISNNLRKIV